MKYVVIFALIVLVIRLDFWVGLVEKGVQRLSSDPTEVTSADVNSKREIIAIAKDPLLNTGPKTSFLSLLENFRVYPDESVRVRAMSFFKSNPDMFGEKLDSGLQASVYRWRDLLILNHPELVKFLLDLEKVLKGENLMMLKEFFSLWMEIDMKKFIAAYSGSSDSNCKIATLFGDNISEVEKNNEYFARIETLTSLLQDESLPANQRLLARNCFQVLKLQIEGISSEVSL